MSAVVEKFELDERQRRGRITFSEGFSDLESFSFDSNDSMPADGKAYGELALTLGVTAISWSAAERELLFSWSRLFSGDETAHRLTAVLVHDFGLNAANICGTAAPKYPAETIAIQHPPGGVSTFVHTRVRLCPVSINRAVRSVSVPLFEKLRIVEGITISMHPFVVQVIGRDGRSSLDFSNTLPGLIAKEFKLQNVIRVEI